MASDISDIDPGDDGGADAPSAEIISAAVAAGAALACLSCGAAIVGPFCADCGQKNDDMRRSTFVLFKDFVKDTFAFDSRMWRTLGLMASRPGLVPSSYSHGKRSRYTPPVRLFLVVSFLFFLDLSLTRTMFMALEVVPKSPEEIVADRAAFEKAISEAGPEAKAALDAVRQGDPLEGAFVVDGRSVECDINVRTRFFVRPQDIKFDEEKWRACSESISTAAKIEIESTQANEESESAADAMTSSDVQSAFERVMAGVNLMASNPAAFNSEINVWLPRVMFFMAPVLALLMALFIRGRDALFFDHLVLSLYSHAAGFAIIGIAIFLAQFGVPHVFPAAMAALALYFIAAMKRAYRRGWTKTVLSSVFIAFFYTAVLASIVGTIIANQIWRAAA